VQDGDIPDECIKHFLEIFIGLRFSFIRRLQLPRLYSSGGFNCLDGIHRAALFVQQAASPA